MYVRAFVPSGLSPSGFWSKVLCTFLLAEYMYDMTPLHVFQLRMCICFSSYRGYVWYESTLTISTLCFFCCIVVFPDRVYFTRVLWQSDIW
jgi:hypothetical protein